MVRDEGYSTNIFFSKSRVRKHFHAKNKYPLMTQATILKDVNILKIKAIVGAQNSPKSSGAKLLYYIYLARTPILVRRRD